MALAIARVWPFDATGVELGEEPSIAEVLLADRLMIGLIRAGLAAVVGYVVVSVPALIVDRRWIQGMTTSGFTADSDQESQRWKDELREGIVRLNEWIETESAQDHGLADLLESHDGDSEAARTDEEAPE